MAPSAPPVSVAFVLVLGSALVALVPPIQQPTWSYPPTGSVN